MTHQSPFTGLLEGLRCSLLLGHAPVGTFTFGTNIQGFDDTFNREQLLMRVATGAGEQILRNARRRPAAIPAAGFRILA